VIVFKPDLAPRECPEVIRGDLEAWAASMVTIIIDYLESRAGEPPHVEVPFMRIAGALLGTAPLGDAIYAILSAMNTPIPVERFGPMEGRLERFADAVDEARAAVYEYSACCWAARRKVLLAWGERAEAIEVGSEEWETAVREVSAVVAEAEGAELRATVFEKGIRRAIDEVGYVLGTVDVDELVSEIIAAGVRHSAPSEARVSS